jgi:hypothetical protein
LSTPFFRLIRETMHTSPQIARLSPLFLILAVIRAGHTSEEETRLVQSLWKMFQDETRVSDRDLSVALQEVPASQAMENGVIMPDVTREN